MKVRVGFVSNSSSSSFVCPFCGETNISWDWIDREDETCKKCGKKPSEFQNDEFGKWLCKKFGFDYEAQVRMYLEEKE